MEMLALMFLFVANLNKVPLEVETWQHRCVYKLNRVVLENVSDQGAFVVGYYRSWMGQVSWETEILLGHAFVSPIQEQTDLNEFEF